MFKIFIWYIHVKDRDTFRGFLIELKYFNSCTYIMHMPYLQQSLRTFRRIGMTEIYYF